MKLTASLETSNLLYAAGLALGLAAAWAVLTLVTGFPLGFLAIPIGYYLGQLVAQSTVERGGRVVAVALGATLGTVVLAKLLCATFTGEGLMVGVIQADPTYHREVVYADEMKLWAEQGKLPPALEDWLQDTSKPVAANIEKGLEEWIERARKRWEQRTPEEREQRYQHYAAQELETGSIASRLGLFVDWPDLAYLILALGAAVWWPMGQADTQKQHVGEVPQDRIDKFDDLEIEAVK